MFEGGAGGTAAGGGNAAAGAGNTAASVGFDPYGRAAIGPTKIEGPAGFTPGFSSTLPGVTPSDQPISYGGPISGNPASEASGGWGSGGGGGYNLDQAQSLIEQGRAAMAAGDFASAFAAFDAADRAAGGSLESGGYNAEGGTAGTGGTDTDFNR